MAGSWKRRALALLFPTSRTRWLGELRSRLLACLLARSLHMESFELVLTAGWIMIGLGPHHRWMEGSDCSYHALSISSV